MSKEPKEKKMSPSQARKARIDKMLDLAIMQAKFKIHDLQNKLKDKYPKSTEKVLEAIKDSKLCIDMHDFFNAFMFESGSRESRTKEYFNIMLGTKRFVMCDNSQGHHKTFFVDLRILGQIAFKPKTEEKSNE